MPVNRKAIEAGFAFEEDWKRSLGPGAELQPGSGNQWFAKLDVDARTVLWWLRCTQDRSFRLTADHIHEAIAAARGPAGAGVVPGWGIRMDGAPDLAIFTQADLFEILRGNVQVVGREPTKAILNTSLADRSLLARTQ